MRVGILGSGLLGGKLGTIFARAGHEVVFSGSRDRSKLEDLAREAGGQARAGTPAEAAQTDAVLFAVNWPQVEDMLGQSGDLSGKAVVSCALPLDGSSNLVIAHTSSGAEALAKRLPAARIVSAFHTVPNEVLLDVFERRERAPRPSLVYSGDDAPAKEVAAVLIRDAGFDPVDAGPLSMARYTEPLAMLIGSLAYGGGSPALAYRLERF